MDKRELIKTIIDENRLVNRRKNEPDSCPCYNGTRCHNTLSDFEMICLLCVCPEYDRSITEKGEGKCKNDSPFGKWFEHKDLLAGRIWDCSDCNIPHTETYTKYYLEQLSFEELQEIRQCRTIQDLWKFYGRKHS